jgi:hypothetical protein
MKISRSASSALSYAKRIAKRYEGITGIDFGYAFKGGKRTTKRTLRFHVAHKKSIEELKGTQVLPETINKFECDVIEGEYRPHADQGSIDRPNLVPGMSVGNLTHRATGSLGLTVIDLRDGFRCVLSNWHVLGGSPDCVAGEEIIQPGPANLGTSDPANKIGELDRWTNLAHGYDAAIARLTVEIGFSNFIESMNLSGPFEPELGMKVVKEGLSSGSTHAMVDGVEGSYPINYSNFGDTTRWMNAIHLIPDSNHAEPEITLDGDSGAVWCESNTGHAVALNFAGESGLGPLSEYALAHPLSRIFELLQIKLPDK